MYRLREKGIAQYLRACQKLFALDFETLEIVRIIPVLKCSAILDSVPIDPRLRAFKSWLKHPTGFRAISLSLRLYFFYF